MFLRIQLFTICILLVSISNANGQEPKKFWFNDNVSPELREQRFTIDSTECAGRAYQLIPEPSQGRQPQSKSGNFNINTPYGQAYGTYNSNEDVDLEQLMNQPSGAEIAYQRGVRQAKRRNYALACIGSLGWQLR